MKYNSTGKRGGGLKALIWGAAGLVLMAGVVAGSRGAAAFLQQRNYRIFKPLETISWRASAEGIYRRDAKEGLETELLADDVWTSLDVRFFLVNPRDSGVFLDYVDSAHFDLLYFREDMHALGWFRRDGDVRTELFNVPFQVGKVHDVRLQVKGDTAALFVDGRKQLEHARARAAGKFGLMIKEVADPVTMFMRMELSGRTTQGERIRAEFPPKKSSLQPAARARGMLPLGAAALLLLLFFWQMFRRCGGRSGEPATPDPELRTSVVVMVHLLLTVVIFWPFVFQGAVLVSSYDNVGEILPLFFLSKHNVARMLAGESAGLWNPFLHNGVPFFSSHWNMIYYPLHWPVFLLPDRWVMKALTLKSFLEVWATGLCAFGFYRRELDSRRWGLFCSLAHTAGAILIFAFTIFTTLSLYFSMTLFLYLLWSMPERRARWNYLWLTLATYMVLTSGNVAFIFYAVLSLAALGLYFCTRGRVRTAPALGVASAAALTGGMLSAVRILSCFWGVAGSNRLVDTYYTLQDRSFLIIRMLVPEITGWFGSTAFNALTSPKLNLIFRHIDLPFNAQNAFFVYFGVLPALLVLLALLVPGGRRLLFWKGYVLVTLAVTLLWQPVWGILSVIFFPFNHYSYQTLMLSAGICALAGHTALRLERGGLSLRRAGRRFVPAVLLAMSYLLVFVTYLYPDLTPWSRGVLLGGGLLCLTGLALRRWSRPRAGAFVAVVLAVVHGATAGALVFTAGVTFVQPIPAKADLVEWVFVPLTVIWWALAGGLLLALYARKGRRAALGVAIGLLTAVLTLAALWRSELTGQLAAVRTPVRTYVVDAVLGHLRFVLLFQAGLAAVLLLRLRRMAPVVFSAVFVALLLTDLAVFQLRFDYIAAPFYYRHAFYDGSFEYQGLEPGVRDGLDLVNYRVAAQDKADVNANKNVIFDIPSYSGIVGYMPQRFSRLVTHFGYPPGAILMYPSDYISNDRFLDLSAVRYVFSGPRDVGIRESALGRLQIVFAARVIEDDTDLLAVLSHPAFNPHVAVLLSDAPAQLPEMKTALPGLMVPITSATTDEVRTQLNIPAPGVLLFNESFDPGWEAVVDGQPAEVLRANYNFMAVVVPSGEHDIRFRYRPAAYVRARNVSLAGLVVLLLAGIFIFLRRSPARA